MIPIALLAGLISGAAIRVRLALLVSALSALVWGILAGLIDSNVSTAIAGAGLAAVNALVGISVGLLARRVLTSRPSTQGGLRAQ